MLQVSFRKESKERAMHRFNSDRQVILPTCIFQVFSWHSISIKPYYNSPRLLENPCWSGWSRMICWHGNYSMTMDIQSIWLICNGLRPLLDMLLVVVLSPAVMMLFIYLTWRLRQHRRRKSELAPTDFVSKLPVRKFKKEKQKNQDHTECAICLEDYADDDTLRTLPCRHEFHASCVDAWLTTHKKFVSVTTFYNFSWTLTLSTYIVSYLQIWYMPQGQLLLLCCQWTDTFA